MPPILKLSDVTAGYERHPILRHTDLTIERGAFVTVTGPNGGGKTTLMRVMLGLLRPISGKVEYFSADGERVRRLLTGYLPQKSGIDTRFPITAAEAVRSGMMTGIFGRLPSDARERFEEVVEMTGIGSYLDHPVGALSGGQLQRTLLARALVCRPELLALDEPLSYVDKEFEHRIYSLMELVSRHTTVILISHEMTAFDRLATLRLQVDRKVRIFT
ncbi:MAG: metal ABC transporter ATP-binding protein [Muribaculaceae bacterium]|nr:metal ABC transporter ATP-binding protein [Muribaculaceae bacterium]